MLTTKNRARLFEIVFALLTGVFLVGCMPAGPRALLDGDRLLQEGKYPEAITRLNEAVSTLPPDSQKARAWNRLGLAYQYSHEVAKSSQAYQQALKLNQDLVEARFNLGCLQLEEGNAAAAIESFTTYSIRQPSDAQGFLKLGEAQLRRALQVSNLRDKNSLLDGAKKSLEQSRSLSPSAETFNALGMIAFQKGRSADAVKLFAAALQTKPDLNSALLNLAIVHHSSRETNERRLALKYYRDYLASRPANAADIDLIATQLEGELNSGTRPQPAAVQTNKPDVTHPSATAVITPAKPGARYKYMLPVRPASGNRVEANRWFALALDAQKGNRLEEAAANYRKTIQADPAFFEAHYNLELVEFERGNLPAALSEAELSLALVSGSVNARHNFALALDRSGYVQDAVNELEKIVAQSPGEARAHLLLGSLYAQKINDVAKARIHFMKVLELEPQHAQAAVIRNWLAANR